VSQSSIADALGGAIAPGADPAERAAQFEVAMKQLAKTVRTRLERWHVTHAPPRSVPTRGSGYRRSG
jgi:hypothetical protein